jgi:hypothetical protein
VYKACFQAKINEQCPDLVVYTDGSKAGDKDGSAFYSSALTKGFRLNGMSSVFTSELFAIREALKAMLKRPCGKVLICSILPVWFSATPQHG